MAFFKKFYKNPVHDRDIDEGSYKSSEMIFHGTVTPHPHFNPRKDAAALEEAIEKRKVDEELIVSVLVNRNNEQRQEIKKAFDHSTGKSLADELKSELRSDLEDVVLALLMEPDQFDAFLLRKATKRLGTNEDVLVEVLTSRTNREIRGLRRAFEKEYEEDLDDVIKSETRGDFTEALLAMLKANKDEDKVVDKELAAKDAKSLFEAGEDTKGTDVSVFIDILTTRSGPQLAKTFQIYSKVSDVNLPKALDLGLRGDIEDCLIDIVKCAWSKPAFFAEKLHLAMKGHGTCEDSLTRVLVSRSEIDLKKILEEYRIMYKTTLQERILEETKGNYQKILLGLCGAH